MKVVSEVKKTYNKINKKDLIIYIFLILLPYLFYFNLFSTQQIWGCGDATINYIPFYKHFGDLVREQNLSFWSGIISLGVPIIESFVIPVFYPLTWLFAIFELEQIYNIFILLHFSIAGIFTYKLVLEITEDRKVALIGAIIYMFCGSINGRRNHVNILHTIAWYPGIIYFYYKMFAEDKFKNIVLFAIFLAIPIYSGGMQHYLYIAISIAIFFFFKIFEAYNKKKWLIKNIISIGFSVLISLPMVLFMYTSMSGTEKDILSYNVFSSYSLPIENLITFIFPNIFGVHVPETPFKLYQNGYIGQGNLTEFGLYVGSLTFIGASYILYKRFLKDKLVSLWGSIFIVSIILSLGAEIPFINQIMFKVPIYNMFRVPSRWLFITNLSIVILFCLFLKNILFDREKINSFKKYYRIIYVFIVWNVALFTLLNYKEVFNSPILMRIKISNAEVLIPIIIMTIYYLYIKEKQTYSKTKYANNKWWTIVLALILIIDVWTFSFFHENVFFDTRSNNSIAEEITNINEESGRIWPLLSVNEYLFNGIGVNYNAYNNLKTVNGYYGMLGEGMSRALNFDARGFNYNTPYLLANEEILGCLGIEYIAISKKDIAYMEMVKKPTNETLIYHSENLKLDNSNEWMIQNVINVKPNTSYKIQLDGIIGEPSVSVVDFFGANYDGINQEFKINTENIRSSKAVLYTEHIPENQETYLRIFNMEQKDLYISNIKIFELNNESQNGYIYDVVYDNKDVIIFKIDNKYLKKHIYFDDNFNIFDTTNIKNDNYADIIEYKNGYLKANIVVSQNINLIFNESYNVGWKVFIDGEQSEIIPVNQLIQGVTLLKGEHVVEFKYLPVSFPIDIVVYIIAFIMIILSYIYWKKYE